jgi:hypothetical protein
MKLSRARSLAFVALIALSILSPFGAVGASAQVSCPVDTPPPAAGETAKPLITLTPQKEAFFIDFRNQRKARSRTIDLEASTEVPSGQVLCVTVVGDLLTSDGHGSIPSSDVAPSVAVDLHNARLVTLTATITPTTVDGYASGEYVGKIRVAGVGLEKVDVPITVTFRSGPNWFGPALALLVIGLGIGIGYLAKWNNAIGRKMGPATRRYRSLRTRLEILGDEAPAEAIPSMAEAADALARWDADGAVIELDKVAKAIGGIALPARAAAGKNVAAAPRPAASTAGKRFRAWFGSVIRSLTSPFRASWWRGGGTGVAVGFFTGVIIALVGFSSQFLAKTTFGVGGFTDWLSLVLWGFGAGFAGKSISDYAGLTAGQPTA